MCQIEDRFLIGISERTNEAGAHQLAEVLELLGFEAETVDIRGLPGLLHLKSGLSYLGGHVALAVDAMARHPALNGVRAIVPPAGEEYASNCVPLDGRRLLFAHGFPILAHILKSEGFELIEADMSEFRKMDGGLSCLSLRF